MLANKNNSKIDLKDLGEFGLIEHLTENIKLKNKSSIKGVGDDAAVLKIDKEILISTDLLVEGVHFDLSYVPLKHLGYKAVMVNLSDIYAMNAMATQITVSIAVSNRFPLEAIKALYDGIHLACERYNVDLIGGDTTSSTTGLLISVTAIGEANKKNIVYRSGAKPSNLLVVTGDLGAAYLGLQVLEREKQVFKANPKAQPELDKYPYLVERQLKPEARKDMVELFQKMELIPTAMIDVSDGLSSEILHICKQSNVGCDLYEAKIPLDQEVISTSEEFNMNSTTVALSGGEDYELLFTISQNDYDKIKANPHLTVIGHITEKNSGINLVTRANEKIEITAQGWNGLL